MKANKLVYFFVDLRRPIIQQEFKLVTITMLVIPVLTIISVFTDKLFLSQVMASFIYDLPQENMFEARNHVIVGLGILVVMAIKEEVLYRLPLGYIISKGASARTVFISAFVLSFIFAAGHLPFGYPWRCLITHTAAGMFFCYFFIQTSGKRRQYWKGLIWVSAFHIGWNWYMLSSWFVPK